MALNTSKMWSNGVKTVFFFFQKSYEKSPSVWGLRNLGELLYINTINNNMCLSNLRGYLREATTERMKGSSLPSATNLVYWVFENIEYSCITKVAISVLLREYKSSSLEYSKLVECSSRTINFLQFQR